MSKTPNTVVFYESKTDSVISDVFTFAVTAGLVLLADGRSLAWQIITIGMFIFFICTKVFFRGSMVKKFYSKRELVEWAQSLPDDKNGGAA